MVDLSGRLKSYQEDVDLGRKLIDVKKEVNELATMIEGLELFKRIFR